MIIGIGIDSVEIARFTHWHTYSQKKLRRIFSAQEIEYSLAIPEKVSERLAARFAAREALYKAWPFTQEPFISFCKKIAIHNGENNKPNLQIKATQAQGLIIHLSITHTKDLATAMVILEKTKN